MEPTHLAYAAGVIDSDGYIGIHKDTRRMRIGGDATQAIYAPRIVVKQVTPEAIEFLHGLLAGSRFTSKPQPHGRRVMFGWLVHSAAAVSACEVVLPYMRIKRQQALNALVVGSINASGQRRRFLIPEVVPGEPMITMAEAARRMGKSYDVVHQSVRLGNVPHVRTGPRKVLIPESYLETWMNRRRSPTRRPDLTERLEALWLRGKELNHAAAPSSRTCSKNL